MSAERNPLHMSREELRAEVLVLRTIVEELRGTVDTYLEMVRQLHERTYDLAHRNDQLHRDVRSFAKKEQMPFVMMKVRSWGPDAQYGGAIAEVRYFGPSQGHNARRHAQHERGRGRMVELMRAPLGRWREVEW